MPRLIAALAAFVLLLAPNAGAGADQPVLLAQKDRTAAKDRTTEKVFSDLERRVIREVLGAATGVNVQDEDKGDKKAKGSKSAPPGLAKRDHLPPGLQRQLERNGRLPPGLAKKEFPPHLTAQLPSPLQGTSRILVGNDAVLIDKATDVILDVIHDVVGNGK